MNKNHFLIRALDPLQYDRSDVFWNNETGLTSPTRKFFYSYLIKYKKIWAGADILDIGCGTGWLLDLLRKQGARSVEGIEPSRKSLKISEKLFPAIKIYNCDLEHFHPKKHYDLIISIMSFPHIHTDNLFSEFSKLYDALNSKGELQMAIPAYDYFRKQRHDYKVNIEDINPDEYITQTQRPHWGLIAEIVRKNTIYTEIAKNAGFSLIKEIPMKPTKELINEAPRYKNCQNDAITYLIRLKKD
jgi:cyclopropane fatty-acyl-phospholipid synthase-like methyltransferase